jgi:hypothetical protein
MSDFTIIVRPYSLTDDNDFVTVLAHFGCFP